MRRSAFAHSALKTRVKRSGKSASILAAAKQTLNRKRVSGSAELAHPLVIDQKQRIEIRIVLVLEHHHRAIFKDQPPPFQTHDGHHVMLADRLVESKHQPQILKRHTGGTEGNKFCSCKVLAIAATRLEGCQRTYPFIHLPVLRVVALKLKGVVDAPIDRFDPFAA